MLYPQPVLAFILGACLGLPHAVFAHALSSETTTLSLTQPTEIRASSGQKKITWSLSLGGEKRQDEFSNQKSQFSLGLNMQFDFELNSWLSLNVSPLVFSKSGYIQSQDISSAEGSGIELKNAALMIQPYSGGSVLLGALNQQKTHTTLLVDDKAFPAAKLILGNNPQSLNQFGGYGQAAIPSAASSTNSSHDTEKNPSLSAVGIYYNFNDVYLKWKNKVGRFQYRSLPLSVSTKSVLIGNSGVSTSGTDMLFAHDFEGTEFQTQLDWTLSKIEFTIKGESVKNDKAPSGSNEALLGKISGIYRMNRHWAIVPEYTYYRIQEDAVVAYYNGSFLNSNYAGYKGGLGLEWSKSMKFSVLGGERVPLVEKTTQSKETTFMLLMETYNAAI
ncbi:MAG: hypothetical protein BroJett040_24000 [Oligoflexia bacterium]|nr:MAG: hypothetical protein BroJett040_24000 [Oligoflexia bacterium]